MNWLDKTIAWVSPETALRRQMAREVLSKRSTSFGYAAAKTDRLTGNWAPTSMPVNYLIGSSSVQVRERVRQLVRDFPYFKRAIDAICDYTVGSGIRYQCRVKDTSGQVHDKNLI
ncbi:MAG: phage portal protein, partial [Acidithiobacillus sp.]|nr:phage portal protein [Acidithiobacillus sp.]